MRYFLTEEVLFPAILGFIALYNGNWWPGLAMIAVSGLFLLVHALRDTRDRGAAGSIKER